MARQSMASTIEADIPQDVIREVHHQVKNTLQVVCSLLRLEGRGVADSATKDLVRRSEARVQAMALVYDTLYRTGSCLEVPLDRYVRSLAEQVVRGWQRAGRELRLEFSLEPLVISTKAAISCGLILNEVLYECGISSGGSFLSIASHPFERGVYLQVEMDQSEGKLLDGPRLSSQIVQALVQQYGGTVDVQCHDVLTYRIELPKISD